MGLLLVKNKRRKIHWETQEEDESVGLRAGTVNVGTITGKGRELAHMMHSRQIGVLWVQVTRWKGSKARSTGARVKIGRSYCG